MYYAIRQFKYKLIPFKSTKTTKIYSLACTSLFLENGDVNFDNNAEDQGYPAGTVASFSCDSGYNRDGPNSATCQPSGTWDKDTPHCNGGNVWPYL